MSVHLLLDARRLNSYTKYVIHPLISRTDFYCLLAGHNGVKFVCTLDVSQAFYSVELDEESKQKFRLALPVAGNFRLLKLAMGGRCSLQEWSRALSMVLSDLQYSDQLNFYADDLFIVSTTNIDNVNAIKANF